MSGFESTLNYTACNEDWESERAALRITTDDEILCVTASGDRPLHLLLDNPAKVVAVDMNQTQNHLLGLKLAAIKTLDYGGYAGFLGLKPEPARRALGAKVLASCTPGVRRFWETHRALLDQGILYQGRWERYYKNLARVNMLMRGDVIKALFEFDDLERQRAFVRNVWDKGWWRSLARVSCSSLTSRFLFGDPGLFTNIAPGIKSVGDYIYDRMLGTLNRHLARENFMLQLLFLGHFDEANCPAYLSAGAFQTLRHRAERVESHTSEITSFLAQAAPQSFSCYSLSDLCSHLNRENFERLLRQLVRTAKPGARFCIRQFLSDHVIPSDLAAHFTRDRALERELEMQDRSFVYRFMVGTIQP